MKVFVIVNNVEGLFNSVHVRKTLDEAINFGVESAAEQCDSSKDEIRDELVADHAFLSNNGDINIHINECEIPEPENAETCK